MKIQAKIGKVTKRQKLVTKMAMWRYDTAWTENFGFEISQS